jgi:outer membrane protein OmpA-like peptidoglycan-associated protein
MVSGRHHVIIITVLFLWAGFLWFPAKGYSEQWVNFNQIIQSLETGDGKTGTIDLSISFSLNSDRLKPSAKIQITELAKAMKSTNLRDNSFEIAGHTDASGNANYNKKLSIRRAEEVKRFLSQDQGINPDRLKTVGWGSEKLKDPLNPTGAINRRVVIKNLSLVHNAPEKSSTVNDSRQEEENIRIDW